MKKPTTLEEAQSVEKYLEYVRHSGEALGVLKPSYVKVLDVMLNSVRVRMARGEWKSGQSNGAQNNAQPE